MHYHELFPARAGMNRPTLTIPIIFSAVPRTGGDEPVLADFYQLNKRCSPHGRG